MASAFSFIIFYIIKYKSTRDIVIISVEALLVLIFGSVLSYGLKDDPGIINDTFDTSSYPLKHVY